VGGVLAVSLKADTCLSMLAEIFVQEAKPLDESVIACEGAK